MNSVHVGSFFLFHRSQTMVLGKNFTEVAARILGSPTTRYNPLFGVLAEKKCNKGKEEGATCKNDEKNKRMMTENNVTEKYMWRGEQHHPDRKGFMRKAEGWLSVGFRSSFVFNEMLNE